MKINIDVNKQPDGYTFVISPTTQKNIKETIPHATPASKIFVDYDTKQDFNMLYGKLEHYIFPALLGIDEEQIELIDEIIFRDIFTKEVLYQFSPNEQKV
jgi:hypothetical protein